MAQPTTQPEPLPRIVPACLEGAIEFVARRPRPSPALSRWLQSDLACCIEACPLSLCATPATTHGAHKALHYLQNRSRSPLTLFGYLRDPALEREYERLQAERCMANRFLYRLALFTAVLIALPIPSPIVAPCVAFLVLQAALCGMLHVRAHVLTPAAKLTTALVITLASLAFRTLLGTELLRRLIDKSMLATVGSVNFARIATFATDSTKYCYPLAALPLLTLLNCWAYLHLDRIVSRECRLEMCQCVSK